MAHLTIDATGKKIGRIATQIAMHLRGKTDPSFAPHKLSGNTVTVTNASKISISDAKVEDKVYTRYTGYPGGLRQEKLGHLVKRFGYGETIRRAVYRMLPNNTLRPKMMKQLTITENE
jgi:large subunit ribosomal protein L13